jgi:GNAT superfamily N-acetyltransferase
VDAASTAAVARIRYRHAIDADLAGARALMRRDGPSAINHLPDACIDEKTQAIADGRMHAVVALDGDEVVGILLYSRRIVYPRHVLPGLEESQVGYVEECVVRRDVAGLGIAKVLLEMTEAHLDGLGVVELYADCDESHVGSMKVMRHGGLLPVETFFDPERRSSGNRRTTISRRRRAAAEPG